jgi:hypothetical protein
VIVERWEKFTGQKADRLPGAPTAVAEEKAATTGGVAAGGEA